MIEKEVQETKQQPQPEDNESKQRNNTEGDIPNFHNTNNTKPVVNIESKQNTCLGTKIVGLTKLRAEVRVV